MITVKYHGLIPIKITEGGAFTQLDTVVSVVGSDAAGACANDADKAAFTKAEENFAADMTACGKKCWARRLACRAACKRRRG